MSNPRSWPPESCLWTVRMLGRYEVVSRDGVPVRFRSKTAAGVFAYLCLNSTRECSRFELEQAFWPDTDGDRQAQNLRRAVADLRTALGASVIQTRKNHVSVNPEEVAIDVLRFSEVSCADSGEALNLYQGPLLPASAEEWVIGQRRDLEERYARLVVKHCAALVEGGKSEEAIQVGRAAVVAAPSREDVHVALIKAYGEAKMGVEALRQYEELERILDESWGEEPSVAAREALDAAFAKSNPPKHNLSAPTTSFIGREKEIEEVCRLLGGTRLLTLTGSGGCGKTRLALECAKAVADRFRDGVWLVELASLAEPGLVAKQVATAVGATEQPTRPIEEVLVAQLKAKNLLVVLDNCEHLVQASAEVADLILRSCPEVVVMASSREGLGVAGESSYHVPRLAVPAGPTIPPEELSAFESVRLLVDRARKVQPSFSVTAKNGAAVSSVCRRLDGIPLAIELAAARLRSLSVEEISERLDDRFRLLTGGSRTALPRQQTLRSLIDWSYDLLSEVERAMLRRLAVFMGGWTLAHAEHVCSGEEIEREDIVDLLASLCDKSLVVREEAEGATRYGMLETIRQYARDRLLESGEGRHWRDRHLDCFIAYGEEGGKELSGSAQQEWLNLLEADHDNFRSALEWASATAEKIDLGVQLAGAIWRFWWTHGYLAEGRDWLERLLASGPVGCTAVRARALRGAGVLAGGMGDYETARSNLNASIVIARQLGDRRLIAVTLTSLGAVAFNSGNPKAARACYEESLQIHRDLGNRLESAAPLGNLGMLDIESGDYDQAQSLLQEALSIFQEQGNQASIASALDNLGIIASERGELARALELHRESFRLLAELDEHDGMGESLQGLAHIAAATGDPITAARMWGAGERLRRDIGVVMRFDERARYERNVAQGREAAGDDEAFDRAWREGAELSLKEVTALALSASAQDS